MAVTLRPWAPSQRSALPAPDSPGYPDALRRELEQRQRDLNELAIAWRQLAAAATADATDLAALQAQMDDLSASIAGLQAQLGVLQAQVDGIAVNVAAALSRPYIRFVDVRGWTVDGSGFFTDTVANPLGVTPFVVLPSVLTSSDSTALITIRIPAYDASTYTFECVSSVPSISVSCEFGLVENP